MSDYQQIVMTGTVVQPAEWHDGVDGEQGYALFTMRNAISTKFLKDAKSLEYSVVCFGNAGLKVLPYLVKGQTVIFNGQEISWRIGRVVVVPWVKTRGMDFNFEVDSFYNDLEQVDLEQDGSSDWRRATRRRFNTQGAAKYAGANAHTQAQQAQKQKADDVQNVNEVGYEQIKSFFAANNIVGEVAQRFYAAELKSGWFKDLDSAQANFRRKLEKERFIFADLRKIMQIAKELVSAKSKRHSANENSMPVLVEDENGEPLLVGRRT